MQENLQDAVLELENCDDGDRIEVSFDPPLKDPDLGTLSAASGTLQVIVSRYYLHCDDQRQSWGMPTCLDLNVKNVQAVKLVETSAEVKQKRYERSRGAPVFDWLPRDAQEIEEQLDTLASLISSETDTSFRGRQRQLTVQFNEIADLVSMAKTKRNYILLRAKLGEDFHPFYTRDDRVYRNETVRPLPADFEIDRIKRINRAERFQQAVRIFGEAERETRIVASALNRMGYDIRRPHPNAQELLVRFKEGRSQADVMIFPSQNGLWESKERPPENKTKARAHRRLLKRDTLKAIAMDLQHATQEI